MSYAILRMSKIKSKKQLIEAELHNKRRIPTQNAKPGIKNYDLLKSDTPIESKFKHLMDEKGIKVRKNAVLAIEYILTYSPNSQVNIKEWARKNYQFISDLHGKDSVLNFVLHLDESTPHIHAIVCPIVYKNIRGNNKWSLCARDYFGSKSKLTSIQNRYANKMKEFGLLRGSKGSKAKHVKIKDYYRSVNRLNQIAEDIDLKNESKPTDDKSLIRLVNLLIEFEQLFKQPTSLKPSNKTNIQNQYSNSESRFINLERNSNNINVI